MLSYVKLDSLRGNVDDSYIDTSNSPIQHIVSKNGNFGANNRRRFWGNNSFISQTLKSKRGMTLIEVVVAMLILSILIIGAHYHFVYGRGQIALRENYRAALQLAAQKLEELKADSYNDITVSKTQETLALGEYSCNRSTDVNDVSLYKKINVQIDWNQMGRDHNVSLDTFIAPKW